MQLEKATKKRRRGRPSQTPLEPWLQRALDIFAPIDSTPKHAAPVSVVPPLRMALRDRSRPGDSKMALKKEAVEVPLSDSSLATTSESSSEDEADIPSSKDHHEARAPSPAKKLPRVILKLGPRPGT